MSSDQIVINVDETLEIDYLVEETSDSSVSINGSSNSNPPSIDYLKKQTAVINPSKTGTYEIELNGQIIELRVTDIPSEPVAKSDLVAWYPFENEAEDETASDPSYGDLTDYTGSISGATKSNNGVTDVLRQTSSGTAYDLSGNSTNQINLPDSAVQTGNSTRTTMCWFEVFEDTGDRQMIVGSANGESGQAWEMEVYNVYNGSGFRQQALGIHTWSGYNITNSGVIGLNEKHHFAATHNGNPSDIQIYLDGEPVDVENNNHNSSSLNTSSNNHRIGYSEAHSTGEHSFEGLIDDFRIYNRVLSDSEIREVYDATKP